MTDIAQKVSTPRALLHSSTASSGGLNGQATHSSVLCGIHLQPPASPL